MKGQYGTPMQAHSKFKNRKEYYRWLKLKNSNKTQDYTTASISILSPHDREIAERKEKYNASKRDEYAKQLYKKLGWE